MMFLIWFDNDLWNVIEKVQLWFLRTILLDIYFKRLNKEIKFQFS